MGTSKKMFKMKFRTIVGLFACAVLMSSCIALNTDKTTVNIAFRPVIGYDTRAEESIPFPEDRSFRVWAQEGSGSVYMQDERVSYNGGWTTSYIWPEYDLTFEACWPIDLPVEYSDKKGIQIKGFDCTSGDVDILLAKGSSEQVADGVLPLRFDHILSRIEFRMMHSLSDEMSVRLKKIELKGFGHKGDYNTNTSDEWHLKEYNASRVVFESEEGAEVIKGEPRYYGDEFYTIPQLCVASIEVSYEVKFTDATWIPQTETISTLEVVWDQSKHYTYTLNLCMDKLKHTTGISSWSNRE